MLDELKANNRAWACRAKVAADPASVKRQERQQAPNLLWTADSESHAGEESSASTQANYSSTATSQSGAARIANYLSVLQFAVDGMRGAGTSHGRRPLWLRASGDGDGKRRGRCLVDHGCTDREVFHDW